MAEAVPRKQGSRTVLEMILETITKPVADHPGRAGTGAATPPSGGEYGQSAVYYISRSSISELIP